MQESLAYHTIPLLRYSESAFLYPQKEENKVNGKMMAAVVSRFGRLFHQHDGAVVERCYDLSVIYCQAVEGKLAVVFLFEGDFAGCGV